VSQAGSGSVESIYEFDDKVLEVVHGDPLYPGLPQIVDLLAQGLQ
jgi:hypothetical protein